MTKSKKLPVGDGTLSVHHWLDLYHDHREQLNAEHYAAVSWWWLAAALRALEDKPTLYPLAVVIGHMVSFMESPGRRHPGGGIAGNSPFHASASQLALLGLDANQVGVGLRMLVKAGLVSIESRQGRDPMITIRCGPQDRRRLRGEYQALIDAGPASARRRGKGRKPVGVASKARAVASITDLDESASIVEEPSSQTLKGEQGLDPLARALKANGFQRVDIGGEEEFVTWKHAPRGLTLRLFLDEDPRVFVDGTAFTTVMSCFKGGRARFSKPSKKCTSISYPDQAALVGSMITGLRRLVQAVAIL